MTFPPRFFATLGLIEQTIKALDTNVEVRFDINEVPHLIRRGGRDDGLQIKIANTELRPCTEDEVRALIPIQAYSQKQLSDVSVRIGELSRFIKGPIRSELSQLSRNQSDAEDRIRQAFTLALQKLWAQISVRLRNLKRFQGLGTASLKLTPGEFERRASSTTQTLGITGSKRRLHHGFLQR